MYIFDNGFHMLGLEMTLYMYKCMCLFFQAEDRGIGDRTSAAGRAKQHSGDETREA